VVPELVTQLLVSLLQEFDEPEEVTEELEREELCVAVLLLVAVAAMGGRGRTGLSIWGWYCWASRVFCF